MYDSKKLINYVGDSVEIFHGNAISVYAYLSVCKVAISICCYILNDDGDEVGYFDWDDESLSLSLNGDIENRNQWTDEQLGDIKEFFDHFGFQESRLFPRRYYPDTKNTLIHLDGWR